MKPQRATNGHMALDAEWKFRCEGDLKARFERVAAMRRRNPADLSRLVFEDFVSAEEQALGLVLREDPPRFRPNSSPGQSAAGETVSAAVAFARRQASSTRAPDKRAKYPAPRRSKKMPKSAPVTAVHS